MHSNDERLTAFTPEKQNKIIQRINIRLVITLGVVYCVSLIDRGNLSATVITGLVYIQFLFTVHPKILCRLVQNDSRARHERCQRCLLHRLTGLFHFIRCIPTPCYSCHLMDWATSLSGRSCGGLGSGHDSSSHPSSL